MSRRPRPRSMTSPTLRTACWAVAALLAGATLAACAASRPADPEPDERFGHRYAADGPDGRRTITIAPPDSATDYFVYPVPFDTVVVRPAPFLADVPAEEQAVEVEVLVKGAFPDGCSDLHHLAQSRAGHLIDLTLEMRKPEGAICASVRRPYRFYTLLEGRYAVGHYTLKVNGRAVPFEIRAPRS